MTFKYQVAIKVRDRVFAYLALRPYDVMFCNC